MSAWVQETYSSMSLSIQYCLFCPSDTHGENISLTIYIGPSVDCVKTPEKLMDETWQRKHPSYILIPECTSNTKWNEPIPGKALHDLVFMLFQEYPIDVCQVYLIGAENGADIVWYLVSHYPRSFAAAIPIAGCADPYMVRNAKYVPVWAFHAKDDEITPSQGSGIDGHACPCGSKRLVDALRTTGSQLAKYTEYESGGHHIEEKVFLTEEPLNWLYENDRRKIFHVEFIKPNIWRIDDYFMSSCYLVVGQDRALVIDTGIGEGDLLALLQSLTSLPIDLAITHPHPDHMYHADRFAHFYLHQKDIQEFPQVYAKMNKAPLHFKSLAKMQWRPVDMAHAMPIEDGTLIDLGGVQLEVVVLSGHTPHHVAYIDYTHQCVFSGDAIGSGYVVGVTYPKGRSKEVYKAYLDNLNRFLSRMPKINGFTYFGGHFIQENSCDDAKQEDYLSGLSSFFTPLNEDVVYDMAELCKRILSNEIDVTKLKDDGSFFVSYNSASIGGTPT